MSTYIYTYSHIHLQTKSEGFYAIALSFVLRNLVFGKNLITSSSNKRNYPIMEPIISNILLIIGIYLALGVVFSILFLWKGITKVDAATEGSGLFFKVLLFPAMTVFWIFFLRKWLKTK